MKLISKNIKIAGGSDVYENDINFPNGYNILSVMSKQIKGDTDKAVNVEFMSGQGTTIIDPMDVRFYEKTTDGFKASTTVPFPKGIQSSTGLKIRVKSDATMTNDTEWQFVFLLEEGKAIDSNGKVVPEELIQTCKR